MNKNTKRVLSAITTASLAGVLGGVAPAVAPSVLNLNGGVVHAAEETHKVTIHYDFYDDPMSPFSSSSSSKVVDVTPNQPLSDHIPETFPGGYVFADAGANSGGSEGERLSSRNDLFGNWTNIYVGYNLKLKKSRTNPSNAGTNNNEKPHKVTIFYCPYDGIPREPTKKVVDVTPNQPLSDHIPETLPGGYVFTGASAFVEGSEGVTLSSRNDLFGNETTFYARYLPKSEISRTNPSNAGTNNNAGTEVKPNNGNTNSGNNNSNAEENIVNISYHFEGDDNKTVTKVKVNIAENPNATVGDYYPLSKNGGDLKYITKGKGMMWVYKVDPDHNYRVDHRGDLLSKYAHLHLLGEYTKPNNAGTEVKPNNDGNANAGTNNNAGTEVKPGNNDNTGNNKPENKPAPENKPNNNSNAENTNTNNNATPSEDIINNIFSNDASGVKVTLTDKTTAAKLSATPVEDKALASSVLEKLNLPADNQIRILDLKLLDKDNQVVNSNAKRTVAIVLKEGEKDVDVYHIKDNGELKLIDSTTKDGVVTFEIDHFSKFAIVSNTNKPAINEVPEYDLSKLPQPGVPTPGVTDGNSFGPKTEAKDEAKDKAKEGSLPNTGMTTSSTAALGLSLIALVGLAVRRKLNN
ncbi:LPXTG cell wall anchor domain-containing protein [uncultured Gemella sp.]|uniref:LPXTG cell wall anchor domain-containing protein n=1 Tax=uncultured Gemella sp. TaxID=254352 RepID=UPI0028D5B7EC|nr:LPXTG cell wall anchor domain-containing protein [uncultured Gemella sp.]